MYTGSHIISTNKH